MSLENNKALAKKADMLWSTGNTQALSEVYAANCIIHQRHPQGTNVLKGLEAWKKLIQEFRAAFPDFQDTVDDQVAEGNKVVTRFTSTGTHKGKFMGIEPTNKKLAWSGIAIDRIENGKIVETWVNWDMHGMLEQMGAAPHLHHAAR